MYENLRALAFGIQLNVYKKTLAKQEFLDLEKKLAELEVKIEKQEDLESELLCYKHEHALLLSVCKEFIKGVSQQKVLIFENAKNCKDYIQKIENAIKAVEANND